MARRVYRTNVPSKRIKAAHRAAMFQGVYVPLKRWARENYDKTPEWDEAKRRAR